jgi:hypothetical protein
MDLMQILTSVFNYFNAPAIALLVMFVGAYHVIHAAQGRDDFDFGNMLKNDSGKESVSALGALVALVLSGWSFVYLTFKMAPLTEDTYITMFMIYITAWSGTKIAEKLVDALASKWTK